MKNRVLLSAVFLLILTQVTAQKFHGGTITGLVASQVDGDTYSGYDKAGLFGGGWVSLNIGERSTVQMEFTYFQKGSRKNPDSLDYSSYLFRANYVEMPLLYQYQINRFTVEAGPSVGILVGYKEKINEYPAYSDNPPALFSFQINIGIRFDINDRWGVDFRTNNSLLNIRKHNVTGDVWRIWDFGQYHDALVLSAYYKLK